MRSILLILFLASSAASAATLTIDFQELEHSGAVPQYYNDVPYSGSEYVIGVRTPTIGNDWGVNGTNSDRYAGSTGLFLNQISGSVLLDRIDGEVFTLESIDLAFFRSDDPIPESTTITFYARDCAADAFCANSHEQSFTLYKNDPFGFQTFLFDVGFTDVTSVSWSKSASTETNVQFDNIAVTAVPVPAAVWLFGSALAGLGWLRRKQTA